MKFRQSAPSNAALIASTQNWLRDSQERESVTHAHRLLLTEYESMDKEQLYAHLIQVEAVAIKLMPYANRHETLAKAFANRIDEIDKKLIEIKKTENAANDVSVETEHGIIFN